MSQSNEVVTEPALERRSRRRFSAADKQRLMAAADALAHGEQGAWLRRNGLYAAQLSQWRQTLTEQGTQGLEPKRGGRQPADPRDHEIERRRRRERQAAPVQPRALSEPEREQIRALSHSAHYRDASLPVIHATELNAGRVIASLSSFYRVLRASGETGERRRQPGGRLPRPHRCVPRAPPGRARRPLRRPSAALPARGA